MATDAEFMTVREVASRLDVSEATVRRMVVDGQLEAIRARKLIRIRAESFSEFCDQKRHELPEASN